MDENNRNFILAIVLSMVVLFAWQFFFVPETPKDQQEQAQEQQQTEPSRDRPPLRPEARRRNPARRRKSVRRLSPKALRRG